MKKNIFSLICGAVLFAMLTAGCSGSFGFDGKDASGLGTSAGNGGGTGNGETGDSSKGNPFKGSTWENSNGYKLTFDEDTCEITSSAAKTASIAREATAGQINVGTYSYKWKPNDDGSFTATLTIYNSTVGYATFTITASSESGTLTITASSATYEFKKPTDGGPGEEEPGGGNEPGTDEANRFEIKDDVLVKYNRIGSETAVTIPDTVKSIGDGVFKECSFLTSVTIPVSVESIGKEAFPGSLTRVYYEGNEDDWWHILFYIGEKSNATGSQTEKKDVTGLQNNMISSTTVEQAMWKANGAKSLWKTEYYPDLTVGMQIETYRGTAENRISIPFGATSINSNAFKDKTISFAFRSIPNTVTSIGDKAFCNAMFLEGLYIPDSVTSIGEAAFFGCWFNNTSIIIPDSVTSIGDDAFFNCSSLESVELSKGMTSIGERVFCGCELRSVKIPDGVTSIGKHAFLNCDRLEEINLPDSMLSIGQEAFNGCSNIKTLRIPDGVTRIESGAFSSCNVLDDVTIPVSVKYIGRNAFPSAGPMKNVKYKGTEADWKSIEFGIENGTSQLIGLEKCVIHGKDEDGNDVEWKYDKYNH